MLATENYFMPPKTKRPRGRITIKDSLTKEQVEKLRKIANFLGNTTNLSSDKAKKKGGN